MTKAEAWEAWQAATNEANMRIMTRVLKAATNEAEGKEAIAFGSPQQAFQRWWDLRGEAMVKP